MASRNVPKNTKQKYLNSSVIKSEFIKFRPQARDVQNLFPNTSFGHN